jgi:hypothetical protein
MAKQKRSFKFKDAQIEGGRKLKAGIKRMDDMPNHIKVDEQEVTN